MCNGRDCLTKPLYPGFKFGGSRQTVALYSQLISHHLAVSLPTHLEQRPQQGELRTRLLRITIALRALSLYTSNTSEGKPDLT